MPVIGPIKRRDLIFHLRQLGFEGPYAGRKHEFMRGRGRTITIPNPHGGDIGREFLVRILRQASITREEWERL